MNTNKPMSILLIEDNELEVKCFKEYLEIKDDVRLVATTNSSYEGIEHTKMYMPEGIILDLELHNGEGSGMAFLEELKNLNLDFKPLIIVTTNVSSNIVYNHIRELGADFIFYKKQSDYSPELVINAMTSLRGKIFNSNSRIKTTEAPVEHENRLKDKINNELDLVGISNHLKGRRYLFDAIFYLLENSGENDESVFSYLSIMYKVNTSTISRAMQTAINHAWKISAIEDLLVHYKARVNVHTGVPTPTEFVYYYADKIKKFL